MTVAGAAVAAEKTAPHFPFTLLKTRKTHATTGTWLGRKL
jgi:hypothetical protein